MKKSFPTILLVILFSSILFFFGPSISIVSKIYLGDAFISEAAKLGESKIDSKKIDKEIDKIIELIKNSLEDRRGSLWLDDWHLKPDIENVRTFGYQRQAVNRMLKDIEGKGIELSEEVKEVFKEVVNNLVEADKLLARTIIEDAKATDVKNPKFQKQVDQLIAKAEEEYEKGLEELEKLDRDQAIIRFSESWRLAQLAIQKAEKESGIAGEINRGGGMAILITAFLACGVALGLFVYKRKSMPLSGIIKTIKRISHFK